MMIEIVLPWFPKECAPNFRSRSHWPKARAIKNARQWAWIAAQGVKRPSGDTIRLDLHFYPPTRHAHDRDNLLASCKAYLDGIASAWKMDDAAFDPHVVIHDPVKNGKVIVTF